MQKLFYYFTLPIFFLITSPAIGQKVVFEWSPSTTEGFAPDLGDIPPYALGFQASAPSIVGPSDLDNDGNQEVILADYSGGGRVHILENAGADTWELIYSSPTLNDTINTLDQARGIGFGNLDGDDFGEFYIFLGFDVKEELGDAIPSPGLIAVEATGNNDFALPNVWNFDGDLPSRFWTEQITVADVDKDGINELMFGNNGVDNIYDSWYVVTASGLGTDFADFNLEKRWTTRADSVDAVDRGGGSAYGIVPADLDGDGNYEILLSSWNYMNFNVVGVKAPDTYEDTDRGEDDQFYAVPLEIDNDDNAFFGCAVVDIDGNKDHEVYCPSFITADLTILNYEEGEDPLEIKDENVVYSLIKRASPWGLTAGDIDQDGIPELIGTGDPYTPQSYASGSSPKLVRIVHYDGSGDVEEPSSYTVDEIEFPMPSGMIFDTVNRDSAGVKTTYQTSTYIDDQLGSLGIRAGKFAFLGDIDDDGHTEVAMSISGVADSVYVYNEVWSSADSMYVRTKESATLNPNRVFMKVLSSDGISTSISNDRVILPTDFELHSNYPNPFNPSTSFSFTLPLDKRVSVKIYDMNGRLIRTLINNEFYAQGTHSVTWNSLSDAGAQVASGQYIYTLEWGQFHHAKRMVLIK